MAFTKIIDFFEYGFLLESCIPPCPIARTMFFNQSIGDYNRMTDEERVKLYNWMMKNERMSNPRDSILSFDKELIDRWIARYNPANQYSVTYTKGNDAVTVLAYRYNSRYYTSIDTFIDDKHITKVVNV